MATEEPFIDYYAVLEIQPNTSDDKIRKAWMRLVTQWQPKANSGDSDATERLQQIHEAYTVLSDPSERAEYDRDYESRRQQLEEEEQRQQHEREEQERLRRESEWLNEEEIERLIHEAEKKQRLEQEQQALESIMAEVSLHEAKRRLEHDRYERRKEIAIIIAIVVLTIAGVVGIGALTWFVIIPFFVNLVTTIWNWIVNTLIPWTIAIGLFAGIL